MVGRLTRDPELKVSQSNVPVGTFNLAVNRPFTNKQGERGADFINCVAFKKQAENVQQYLSKGSLVGIDGRLQSRSYENKEGRTVYVTEVVCDSVQFLEPKNKEQDRQYTTWEQENLQKPRSQQMAQRVRPSYVEQKRGAQAIDSPAEPVDISNDDLPF